MHLPLSSRAGMRKGSQAYFIDADTMMTSSGGGAEVILDINPVHISPKGLCAMDILSLSPNALNTKHANNRQSPRPAGGFLLPSTMR